MNIDTLNKNTTLKNVKKMNINLISFVNNGDYQSYKIINYPVACYFYIVILYFFNEKLTHIQISSSSKNDDENKALNFLEKKINFWKVTKVTNDKKSDFNYLILD